MKSASTLNFYISFLPPLKPLFLITLRLQAKLTVLRIFFTNVIWLNFWNSHSVAGRAGFETCILSRTFSKEMVQLMHAFYDKPRVS